MHLLVTRPEPDAERTAALLRQNGHRVTIAPALRLEAVADADLGRGPYAAVVLTSSNAARAISSHVRRPELTALPAFTVGRHTAAAARAAGFSEVASADGGFPELVRLIAASVARGASPLLYPCAEHRSGDLAGALLPHGLTVETVVVYRAAASATLAQQIAAALSERPDGVLHYSRRSAQAFLQGAETAGCRDAALRLVHYCLSDEIASVLRAAGATAVRVAARPEEAALLALLGA